MRMTPQRFAALWRRCLADRQAGDGGDVYAQLRGHYGEPHRRYHTPAHIEHCLQQFDLARDQMEGPDAVEMAIWFHDVIYCPGAGDNERRSAEFFAARAAGREGAAFGRCVQELILATGHVDRAASGDQSFLIDIDLSSFGLPWAAFEQDSAAVREEYGFVPDADYFEQRIRFLESLLARPTFFLTAFFRTRYERAARRNITRHLAQIRARGA